MISTVGSRTARRATTILLVALVLWSVLPTVEALAAPRPIPVGAAAAPAAALAAITPATGSSTVRSTTSSPSGSTPTRLDRGSRLHRAPGVGDADQLAVTVARTRTIVVALVATGPTVVEAAAAVRGARPQERSVSADSQLAAARRSARGPPTLG